ncbi:MAG TPA: hypothetical protein VGH09_12650 [Solirubrobacteraceae bacterium]|jgi:hypothetical protein
MINYRTTPFHSNTSSRRAAVVALSLAALLAATGAVTATATRTLAYSTATARQVQRQPRAGACHALGTGLYARPDARCTPGALNPQVSPATIATTICHSGWTATVRPPESITRSEKLASLLAYSDQLGASAYEYDHLVPLELGGAVNDPRNLWPEPDYGVRSGFYLNPKDRLERVLNRLVCDGTMRLATAQRLIATDWVSAFRSYG